MTISRLKSNDLRQPINGNFTNTATGSGSGYKYVSFTANGTLVVDVPGLFWVFLIGSGSGGDAGGVYTNMGSGGNVIEITNFYIPVGSHSVTVGSSSPCTNVISDSLGKPSKLGTLLDTGYAGKQKGAGYNGSNAIESAYVTTITGSSQSFGAGSVATPAANTGQGSYSYFGNPSGSGIVIVRATL